MDLITPIVISIIGILCLGMVFVLSHIQKSTHIVEGTRDNTTVAIDGKSKLTDDSWALFFAILNAIGSIATAIALYFVAIQSRNTQRQVALAEEEIKNTTPRPWIGISRLSLDNFRTSSEVVRIYFKNYGRIPAVQV